MPASNWHRSFRTMPPRGSSTERSLAGPSTRCSARLPAPDEVRFEQITSTEGEQHRTIAGLLRNAAQGSELPVVVLEPKSAERARGRLAQPGWQGGLVRGRGPTAARDRPPAGGGRDGRGRRLDLSGRVSRGRQTAGKDPPRGESARSGRLHLRLQPDGVRPARARRVERGPLRNSRRDGAAVYLVGLDGAGPWAAAALAQADGAVTKGVLDTGAFRFGKVLDIHSPDFLPGGAKYFDLPGMVALAAPTPLWIVGEGSAAPAVIAAAYRATGGQQALTVADGEAAKRPDEAVQWLLRQ